MKISIAAGLCLVLSVLKLILPGILGVPTPSGIASTFVLVLASLYLVAAGVSALRKEELREKQGTEIRILEERAGDLERRLRDSSERENGLATQLRQASTAPKSEPPDAAVVPFLALLQRSGRFIDFLMDDIAGYDDKQVGAAARVVHQGCARVLHEYFQIVPVRADSEGEPVTLDKNFDASCNRLVGKVVGGPPFHGVVLHRGWKTTKVSLPRALPSAAGSAASEIIAPAEIEVRSHG